MLAAFLSCVMRKPDLDNEDEVFDECHNALPGRDEAMDKSSPRNIDGEELLTAHLSLAIVRQRLLNKLLEILHKILP